VFRQTNRMSRGRRIRVYNSLFWEPGSRQHYVGFSHYKSGVRIAVVKSHCSHLPRLCHPHNEKVDSIRPAVSEPGL
jgi:hypothetical protein